MRSTYSTALVLEALSHGYHYGFDIMDATNLPSGTVYPILRRLEREGMVTSQWEDSEVAQNEPRPQRRYYEMTADGRKALADTEDRYRAPRGARALRPARHSRG